MDNADPCELRYMDGSERICRNAGSASGTPADAHVRQLWPATASSTPERGLEPRPLDTIPAENKNEPRSLLQKTEALAYYMLVLEHALVLLNRRFRVER